MAAQSCTLHCQLHQGMIAAAAAAMAAAAAAVL
jgi:hypothetical protein